MVFEFNERPRHILATRDPARIATFWRPATRATPRPCQPCSSAAMCHMTCGGAARPRGQNRGMCSRTGGRVQEQGDVNKSTCSDRSRSPISSHLRATRTGGSDFRVGGGGRDKQSESGRVARALRAGGIRTRPGMVSTGSCQLGSGPSGQFGQNIESEARSGPPWTELRAAAGGRGPKNRARSARARALLGPHGSTGSTRMRGSSRTRLTRPSRPADSGRARRLNPGISRRSQGGKARWFGPQSLAPLPPLPRNPIRRRPCSERPGRRRLGAQREGERPRLSPRRAAG